MCPLTKDRFQKIMRILHTSLKQFHGPFKQSFEMIRMAGTPLKQGDATWSSVSSHLEGQP